MSNIRPSQPNTALDNPVATVASHSQARAASENVPPPSPVADATRETLNQVNPASERAAAPAVDSAQAAAAKQRELLKAIAVNQQYDQTHINNRLIAQMPAVERLQTALSMARTKVGPELAAQIDELLKPENLALIGGITAIWGAAHLNGSGEVADLVMLGTAAVVGGLDGLKAINHVGHGVAGALTAETRADFEGANGAATRLAQGIVAAGEAGLSLSGVIGVLKKVSSLSKIKLEFAPRAVTSAQAAGTGAAGARAAGTRAGTSEAIAGTISNHQASAGRAVARSDGGRAVGAPPPGSGRAAQARTATEAPAPATAVLGKGSSAVAVMSEGKAATVAGQQGAPTAQQLQQHQLEQERRAQQQQVSEQERPLQLQQQIQQQQQGKAPESTGRPKPTAEAPATPVEQLPAVVSEPQPIVLDLKVEGGEQRSIFRQLRERLFGTELGSGKSGGVSGMGETQIPATAQEKGGSGLTRRQALFGAAGAALKASGALPNVTPTVSGSVTVSPAATTPIGSEALYASIKRISSLADSRVVIRVMEDIASASPEARTQAIIQGALEIAQSARRQEAGRKAGLETHETFISDLTNEASKALERLDPETRAWLLDPKDSEKLHPRFGYLQEGILEEVSYFIERLESSPLVARYELIGQEGSNGNALAELHAVQERLRLAGITPTSHMPPPPQAIARDLRREITDNDLGFYAGENHSIPLRDEILEMMELAASPEEKRKIGLEGLQLLRQTSIAQTELEIKRLEAGRIHYKNYIDELSPQAQEAFERLDPETRYWLVEKDGITNSRYFDYLGDSENKGQIENLIKHLDSLPREARFKTLQKVIGVNRFEVFRKLHEPHAGPQPEKITLPKGLLHLPSESLPTPTQATSSQALPSLEAPNPQLLRPAITAIETPGLSALNLPQVRLDVPQSGERTPLTPPPASPSASVTLPGSPTFVEQAPRAAELAARDNAQRANVEAQLAEFTRQQQALEPLASSLPSSAQQAELGQWFEQLSPETREIVAAELERRGIPELQSLQIELSAAQGDAFKARLTEFAQECVTRATTR